MQEFLFFITCRLWEGENFNVNVVGVLIVAHVA